MGKLPAHLSLQQVSASAQLQLSGAFQPQEFGYGHSANSPHSRQPTVFHNPLRVLSSNSSWNPSPISKDSHHKSELTTTGVLFLSVFPWPK